MWKKTLWKLRYENASEKRVKITKWKLTNKEKGNSKSFCFIEWILRKFRLHMRDLTRNTGFFAGVDKIWKNERRRVKYLGQNSNLGSWLYAPILCNWGTPIIYNLTHFTYLLVSSDMQNCRVTNKNTLHIEIPLLHG